MAIPVGTQWLPYAVRLMGVVPYTNGIFQAHALP